LGIATEIFVSKDVKVFDSLLNSGCKLQANSNCRQTVLYTDIWSFCDF